jgi:hypothetical protein
MLAAMSSLEARIARLERHNRFLRAAWLLSAIAVVSCGSGTWARYGHIDTQKLVIVDASEKPLITLADDGTLTFHAGTQPVVLDAETCAKLLATLAATPAP